MHAQAQACPCSTASAASLSLHGGTSVPWLRCIIITTSLAAINKPHANLTCGSLSLVTSYATWSSTQQPWPPACNQIHFHMRLISASTQPLPFFLCFAFTILLLLAPLLVFVYIESFLSLSSELVSKFWTICDNPKSGVILNCSA